MQQITIAECTRVLMLEFEQNGYSENTRREKSLTFGNIDRWFQKNGSIYYDCNLAREYEASVVAKFEAGVFAKTRRNSLLNGMRYVSEYAETGTITLSKRRAPALLSDYFQGVLDLVLNNDQWTDAKRRNVGYAAHTYFRWLQQNGILTLSAVNDDVLRKYIIRCADCMTPGSLDTIRRNLKNVHGFLHELGIIEHNYADTLSFTTPAMHRIQKPIPADDIAEVLAAVDRSTSTGKRDFAMILLATVTGLRSVDIRKLAFSDIDWVNGEIRLVQSKTGNTLALPLTTDVGEAIQDYILNGRPASDLPNIFLSAKSPHIALHSHGLYNAFNKYREKLGRPVCAVHGLRRAVGTNMVVAGIPVTTVAQVLGHSRISATKQYISLDSAHLKQCALDFTGLPDRGVKFMDDFNSCFAEKLNEYVSFRHALGFSGIHHRCLKFFDEYCVTFHPNERALTAPLVKGWIKYEINAGRGSIESKQSAIRAFAKFVGNDSYILTELYHVQKKDFKPYLLSEKELSALLYAADHLEKPRDPFFAETAGVIFRLMYTCGLRPTEARCLKRTHINFDTGELFISKSKRSKDRIVVASSDMIGLLQEYDNRRSIFCGDSEFFFIHTNGNQITAEHLTDLLWKCWKNANPDIEPSLLPRLRPYDLRHLFASTVLQTWIDEGKNIYAQLPYLRSYMGHEDFRDTLYYIHILPERLLMSPAINWEQIESAELEDSLWSQ